MWSKSMKMLHGLGIYMLQGKVINSKLFYIYSRPPTEKLVLVCIVFSESILYILILLEQKAYTQFHFIEMKQVTAFKLA